MNRALRLIAVVFTASLVPLIPTHGQEIPKDYQEVLVILGKSGDFSATC